MYFINELKYSKRSEQGTNDAMSLFWLLQKLSHRTLLSYEFLLPCDESRHSTASRLFPSCSLPP